MIKLMKKVWNKFCRIIKGEYKPVVFTFDKRASGNTTRLVDHYIQELFTNVGSPINIRDHFEDNKAHRLIISRIITRLHNEHPGTDYSVNYCKLTITLLDNNSK